MKARLLLQLVAVFLVTQAIGLYVGTVLIGENVQATIVTENPEDVVNAVGLIVYILAVTAGILIAIYLFKGRMSYYLFKAIETIAVFGTSWIVFSAFLPIGAFAFWLAVLLVVMRIVFSKNILLRNAASVLAAAGVGAIVGVSLGILPVIVFIALLAAYDFIAVFKTKHMVVMAKAVSKKNLAFTYALPTEEHQFELGTGDLVVPMAFSVAVLKASAFTGIERFVPPIAVLAASLVGLIITLDYGSKNIGKALPALPLQAILMVLVFAAAKLAGL